MLISRLLYPIIFHFIFQLSILKLLKMSFSAVKTVSVGLGFLVFSLNLSLPKVFLVRLRMTLYSENLLDEQKMSA